MTEAELGLLIEIAVQCLLVSLREEQPSTDLLSVKRGTMENFSWHSSWSLLLTCAKAEAWLSLLDNATTADSCLLSQLY